MFRSATVKLTLYYLAIVMVISLSFSGVLFRVASNALSGQLHDQYQRWHFALRYFDNDPTTPAPAPPSPAEELDIGTHVLLLRLVYFNVIVLVAAGGASYLLARRTLEPIEAAHEQQKRFTADVSHELRTPLTALKMESEVALLDKKATSKSLRQTLSSNLEEAAKLEGLINNLLRLAQLENTEARALFNDVALDKVVEEALVPLKKLAKNRNISINTQLQSAHIYGDATTLKQLVTILVDNAIKYSPNQTAVGVTLRLAGDKAAFSVTDQGVGIDSAAMPHIFDRFYREDQARKKDGSEGFGLGLSLAKLIVDLHQGHIKLDSKPGQGTTATVVFTASSGQKTADADQHA